MASAGRGLRVSVTLLCFLIIFHVVAVKFYFYWSFWWFDLLMHIFAGMAVTLTAFYYLDGSAPGAPNRKLFYQTLGTVLLLALLWELYEFFTGATYTAAYMYFIDSGSDILMDIVGWIIGLSIAYGTTRA